MKVIKLVFVMAALLAVRESLAQATVRMATEDYVTNRVAIATNALPKVAHTGDFEDLINVPEIPDPEEKDPRAWRLYHYGDPDIVESPAEWFQFDPLAKQITNLIHGEGRTHIIIPWEINGVPVTAIGDYAFYTADPPCNTVIAPRSVSAVGIGAFAEGYELTTVRLPGVQQIGEDAFYACTELKHIKLSGVTNIADRAFCDSGITMLFFDSDAPEWGADIFLGRLAEHVKIYVTNPAAKNWPESVQDVEVIRLPLYTDSLTAGTVTLGGVERGTWPTVDPVQVENIAIAVAEQVTTNFLQSVILDSDNWVTFEDGVQTWWHRDAQGQTNEVWRSDQSGAELAIEVQQLRSQVQTLTTQLESALAWGDRAPDGSDNPDPEYMVLLNRPATMHMSGYQWQTYGTYAVLTTSGAVAFESGSDGGMRIGPDNENYFGFIGGGSVTVGAMAKSLHVEDGGTPEGEAYIAYEYSGGSGFPILWYTPDLREVPFAEQDGVVWVDNQDGTATATAPATGERGFWMATTTRQIDYVFNSTMPAFLQGGVMISTNAVPVVYDSVIHIESGEKTFRIPAEEVQQ